MSISDVLLTGEAIRSAAERAKGKPPYHVEPVELTPGQLATIEHALNLLAAVRCAVK